MPLYTVTGDPTLTSQPTLAFGYNAQGRTETRPLQSALATRQAAAFASFRKQATQQRVQTGGFWQWNQGKPSLLFLLVRETPVGATRLRYVQSVLLTVSRDHRLLGIKGIALARLGDDPDWPEIKPQIDKWWGKLPFPVVVYETYVKGVRVDEAAHIASQPE